MEKDKGGVLLFVEAGLGKIVGSVAATTGW